MPENKAQIPTEEFFYSRVSERQSEDMALKFLAMLKEISEQNSDGEPNAVIRTKYQGLELDCCLFPQQYQELLDSLDNNKSAFILFHVGIDFTKGSDGRLYIEHYSGPDAARLIKRAQVVSQK